MTPDDTNFEFVLHEPNKRLSRENRSRIRRHAMRAVGTTRRAKGNHDSSHRYFPLQHDLPSIPSSGLELLVKDYGLDPMDLSALVSIHIGTIASLALKEAPGQLARILACRQKSYFSFVPRRFGHVPALDDSFRCLITLVHSMVVVSHKQSEEVVLGYYGRALGSLQSAVDDPQQRYTAEALCAASFLALFEILKPTNEQLWGQHIVGASRLIQLRGASAFNSEFEQALLTGLSYPISAEALLNNKRSFLEEPEWTQALRNALDKHETFTDRSPLGVEMMILMAKVPGLATRTTHAVVAMGNDEDSAAQIEDLVSDIYALRSKVIAWRRNFNTALIRAIDIRDTDREATQRQNFNKRYELLGVSLVVGIMASRMLVCVAPKDRGLLEDEVQSMAIELRQVHTTVGAQHHRADFLLAQKAKIANAAIATHADFQRYRDSGSIIEPSVLKTFCKSLGRKCGDEESFLE